MRVWGLPSVIKQPEAQPIDLPQLTDSNIAQEWIDKITRMLPEPKIMVDPMKFDDKNIKFIDLYLENELQFLESHPEVIKHKPQEDDQDA